MSHFVTSLAVLLVLCTSGFSQEPSRYMGGPVKLVEAPNGAIANAEILEVSPKITYMEPTVEEVVDGVWCIGGYSLTNTTVIETEDGLYFRVRIDPRKSENTDRVLEFVFTDKGDRAVGLHVRRGVVEFIPVPADYLRKPDSVLKLDSQTWAALYLSAIDLKGAIDSGNVELAEGDLQETVDAFAMFDRFVPTKNFTIPPLED